MLFAGPAPAACRRRRVAGAGAESDRRRTALGANKAAPPVSTPASAESDVAKACATAARNSRASARGRPLIVSTTETRGRLARPGEADAEVDAEGGSALALAVAEFDAEADAVADAVALAVPAALTEAMALADAIDAVAAKGAVDVDSVGDADCERVAAADSDASSEAAAVAEAAADCDAALDAEAIAEAAADFDAALDAEATADTVLEAVADGVKDESIVVDGENDTIVGAADADAVAESVRLAIDDGDALDEGMKWGAASAASSDELSTRA